jgi:hypothetical protein
MRKAETENGTLDRRSILLAGSTLAAATAAAGLGMGVQAAVAQAQQAAPSGRPNILVIMGDDIGWFNIGAYHRGRRRISTSSPPTA